MTANWRGGLWHFVERARLTEPISVVAVFEVRCVLRGLCNRYVACDVVPSLIDFNRARFKHLEVEFKVLDLTEDELPPGDKVFVRQVLQHLSNDQVCRFIARVPLNICLPTQSSSTRG